jgi:hypothetical protein
MLCCGNVVPNVLCCAVLCLAVLLHVMLSSVQTRAKCPFTLPNDLKVSLDESFAVVQVLVLTWTCHEMSPLHPNWLLVWEPVLSATAPIAACRQWHQAFSQPLIQCNLPCCSKRLSTRTQHTSLGCSAKQAAHEELDCQQVSRCTCGTWIGRFATPGIGMAGARQTSWMTVVVSALQPKHAAKCCPDNLHDPTMKAFSDSRMNERQVGLIEPKSITQILCG